MSRAFLFVSTKRPIHYFSAENKCYRYWYTPQIDGFDGVLKLQIKRSDLAKFRETPEGRNVSRFVDLFEVGGGWCEVRSANMTEWNRLFGTDTDGLKMWVRELNRWNVGMVNANRPTANVQYVARLDRSLPRTHKVDTAHTAYQVDPSKLAKLATKFGRHHGKR
jgi:hypothetical protein